MNKTRKLTADRLKMIEEKGLSMYPLSQPLEIDLESQEHWEQEMEKQGGRDPLE